VLSGGEIGTSLMLKTTAAVCVVLLVRSTIYHMLVHACLTCDSPAFADELWQHLSQIGVEKEPQLWFMFLKPVPSDAQPAVLMHTSSPAVFD
jgi:hypothetical protein